MGARSYIAQQNDSNIQSTISNGLKAFESVVGTQVANNGEIIQDQINQDLETNVYGNPDTEKWEDLSTSVFDNGYNNIDQLNISSAAKKQLKSQIDVMKQSYESSLPSKKEEANIVNLQVELNESAKLIATKPENSLTKSYNSYNDILNNSSAKAVLDERGTDYVTSSEYLDTLVPTKALQYVQNSIDNAPTSFMNTVTNEDGSVSSTPITVESIAENTINSITKEMTAIKGSDWEMSDSQKADIKSAASTNYNAKMTELNTSASNNSNAYSSQIMTNYEQGKPTDTDTIKEYYDSNYPPFIANTVGKELIDYANAKNDQLTLGGLAQKYQNDYSSMTQEDIDSIKLDANRSEVAATVITAKALQSEDNLTDIDSFIDNCGIELKATENLSVAQQKAAIIDNVIKSLTTTTEGSSQDQINALLSKRFTDIPHHDNLIGDLSKSKATEGKGDTGSFIPETATETKVMTGDQLIPKEKPTKEQLTTYNSIAKAKGEDSKGIAEAIYGNYTYIKAMDEGLIPSYVTESDFNDAVTEYVNSSSDSKSVSSVKQTLLDAQLSPYVSQTQLDKAVTAAVVGGFLSTDDAKTYSSKPSWMDFSDYNETSKMIDDIINTSYSKSTSIEKSDLRSDASDFLDSWLSSKKPTTNKEWDELKINLQDQLSKTASGKILKNFSKIAKDLDSVSDATSLTKVIDNKNYDEFMDEYQQGKWDFFIDSNDLDDIGQSNHFIQGDPNVTYDSVESAVIKSLIGDADPEGMTDITKAKVKATSTMILAINRQSQLFKNTFDVKNVNIARIGNDYGYEVSDGIFAMLINSDTEKAVKKDGFFGNTHSNWKLVKAKKDSSGSYNFENFDKKGNANSIILSNMDTDTSFQNVQAAYKASSDQSKKVIAAKDLMNQRQGSQQETLEYVKAKQRSEDLLKDFNDISTRYDSNMNKLTDGIKFLQTKTEDEQKDEQK